MPQYYEFESRVSCFDAVQYRDGYKDALNKGMLLTNPSFFKPETLHMIRAHPFLLFWVFIPSMTL